MLSMVCPRDGVCSYLHFPSSDISGFGATAISTSISKNSRVQTGREGEGFLRRSFKSDLMESESGEGPSSFSATDDTTDAELLKRAWRTEKAAPEILMFEKDLVQRSRGQIQLVEENVELSILNGDDPLTVSLNQMDLDRTLYLLRSYLRTRLQKIEKYMIHIHKNNELWERLSEEEQNFAKRCIEDLADHLDKSVLSKLPDRYQSSLKQSPISEEDDMVPEPDLDTFVICRTTKSLGALQLDNSGEEDPVVLEPNHIYAIRYRPIKPRVYDGQIDLV